MTLEQAQAGFEAATEAYRVGNRSADDHRAFAKYGMANSLGFAEMVEHTAYHRWLRAHENLAKLQPIVPKPMPAPKTVATVASAKPTPVSATKPVSPSYAEAKRSADSARNAYQATMKRLDEAHRAAVADAQSRHAAKQQS